MIFKLFGIALGVLVIAAIVAFLYYRPTVEYAYWDWSDLWRWLKK